MRLAALLVLLSLTAAASSAAAPITIFEEAFFPNGQYHSSGSVPIALTGTFTPFDESLGTLQSVRIFGDGSGSASITLSNLAPGDYSYTVGFSYSLIGPGDIVLATAGSGLGYRDQVVLEDGSLMYAPFTGVPFEALFSEGNNFGISLYPDAATGLEYFSSPNEFTHAITFYVDVTGPGFAPGTRLDPDSFGGWLGVTGIAYTYEPVPEPGTALLVGLGLSLLGATRAHAQEANAPRR